ncbi:DNRLRE domain-containing protein [Actinosynnema sp. NPDC050801]|uniref:DNRLRE domain-containing protein n=1 Tax=unclassified Actinosynnema TaxID=2637065 RepID=UPI00340B56B3
MATALALVLAVSTAETLTPPAAAAPPAPTPAATAPVESRPDVVSAGVSARAQGSRVEVESMRTETSSTWSNPDGTLTTEAHGAPIRFKDHGGDWRTMDLKWRKDRDGSVAPTGHPLGLKLGRKNAKAGTSFVTAAADQARQVEWLAPWTLPEPKLDGTKATYPDVEPGVDLVLHTRRSGFEYDFVVKTRPAAAPVWRIPLRVKGLTARQQPDGTIDFLDAKGEVHSSIPVPLMWDAEVDERSGESVNRAAVGISVETAADGSTNLVVAPDPVWFNDPKRTYPITVDPTYAVGTAYSSFDTWVQSDHTTDQSASSELKLGTYNGGAVKARSFLNFSVAPFKGKQIVSAHLSMFETWSYSCTPSTMIVRSTHQLATTATRWTAQPTFGSQYGSTNVAKGHDSGCPAGRMSVPITPLVQAWSSAPYTVGGMVLMAGNEADSNSWKRFHSSESSADPFISYTYNRPPGAPATVEPSEAVAYAAPGETSSWLYSPSLRPWVRTKATDPDGNTVKYVFEFYTGTGPTFSLKGTCTSSVYASGTTAGCRPATDLPDNTLLYVRAKANDGRLDGPWVNYNQRLRTGAATPAQPVVSCPAPFNVSDTWQDAPPTTDVTCTITATGTGYNAPGYLRLIVDGKRPAANFTGGAEGQIKITPSGDPAVAKHTVTFPKDKAGLHTIVVQAETPAGKLSPSRTHKFGWGGTTLTSPTSTPRTTTTDNIRVTASGPPRGTASSVTAKVKWRVSGYGGNDDLIGWNDATDLPVTDNGAGGVNVNALWDTNLAKIDANLDADPDTAGIQPTTLNDRIPVKLDVQVCFKYGTSTEQCTWSQSPGATVQRLPHAFGNGFPVSEAGPGQVALWTGEFHTESTDISVPGYTGDLSLSRSHSTFAGATDAVNGVFGPGWTAQFDGADAGVAGAQVVDNTRADGTIVLLEGDGTALVFESPNTMRRTTASLQTGTWPAADEETSLGGGKLTVTGTGAATTIAYTEDDGTTTTFTTTTAGAPTAGAGGKFRPAGITEAGVAGKTTYTYDPASGRVARIVAPAAPGVVCTDAQGVHTNAVGCRSLRLEYGTSGSANGRLVAAWLDIFNPDKTGGPGMDAIKVAAYTYDTAGRLATATDPRDNLTTTYGYDSGNRLTSVKPAGLAPFQLSYTAAPNVKLATVKRDRPAGDPTGGVATLASFVYDVPTTGAGLPDLSAGSVERWNQAVAPVKGFAVFGPDHPVGSTSPSGIAAGDWEHADLQYTDAQGYTVNTAKHGAGAWQLTATDYNAQGNVVRELDERALRLVLDGAMPSGAAADQLATLTVYNADVVNGSTVVTPAGTLVTDTYGPTRTAALRDGSSHWLRTHTRTEFDRGAPHGGINPATTLPYRLATAATMFAHDPGTGQDVEVVSRTLTDYAPPVAGDADGWAMGLPGRVTTDVDLDGTPTAGDIVQLTRYDAEGRTVETRQPTSTGADAGTTRTVHYTAAANTTHAECGGKPQWAGLVCKTHPAAAPSSGPTLPTTTTTGFSYLLAPTAVVETSGAVTRTTSTTYLPDGRTASTSTAVTGLAGSTPNTRKETEYDPLTGAATKLTAKNADGSTAGTVTTGYDSWGRQTSYQPSGETPTTTVYDAAGSVATVTDANGSTRYTYDGTDAAGRTEHRGLATKVEVTTAGSTWTSTGAYDADGGLITQKLPGGITRHTDLDNAGEPVGLRYTGRITTVDEDGTTTVDPDGGWLAWSQDNDVTGRVVREWTPQGSAFTGPAGSDPGDAVPYDRAYTYDPAGRLTQVRDRTAATTGVDITDPAETPACVTRSYGFDGNHNRLTKTTTPAAADGTCTTTGGTTTNRAFDTADRPVTGAGGQGAYTYDPLGRTLTLPASDAVAPQGGDITLAYHDNDLAKSITQGGTTTAFTLDANDRRAVETVTGSTGSTQTVHHYTDASDNPTWVTGNGATRRYAELIGGNLALTVDNAAVAELTVADLHGDVVTTVDLPAAGAAATSITGWNAFDEYGAPSGGNTAGTGEAEYGWLGAEQRAVSGAGLVLMGVRLYNPVTGLFTSTDPVVGGGANRYAYPTNPIGMTDLDGRVWGVALLVGAIYAVIRVCWRFRQGCARLAQRIRGAIWRGLKWVGRKLRSAAKWLVAGAVGGLIGNAQDIAACVKQAKQGYREGHRKNFFRRIGRAARRCVTG